MRGPLYQDNYRPQFSGHETFPLRYGWLKKAFDRVLETEDQSENRAACWGDDAIARFGIGKNMVASMRHWAKAVGVVEEPTVNSVRTTELGHMLFGASGLDPYMENPATLWLVHWQLAAREHKTTWFWTFNHYPAIAFERDSLIKSLGRLADDRKWSRVANSTIRNDVACFIRTYVSRRPSGKTGQDDALESPLTELGLIKANGNKESFRFVRGPKTTLGNGVFTYALMDFWSRYSNAATLSIEAIAHAASGPGRAFLFDENDVADRLATLDDITDGALRWSESAGLKQVERNIDLNRESAMSWVRSDYPCASW
ncbi:MAG: DUF4007 family protein [Gammaproteobacteria bacterium]|nr:DUF4007 family protein [Gammaproteobacteria bacterium]